jgi:hypothetical protein
MLMMHLRITMYAVMQVCNGPGMHVFGLSCYVQLNSLAWMEAMEDD